MAVTKKQIIYAGVLVVAAGAFAWDRTATGPVTTAAAPVGALARGASKPPPVTPVVAAAPVRKGLGPHLMELAHAERLDLGGAGNAFGLSPLWTPPPKVEDAGKPAKPSDEELLVEAFVKKHKLDAVMVRGRGGYAMIDGKALVVGQSVDKFKLVSVTKTTAVFSHGERRVELRLAADAKLVREGWTIEDRSPETNGVIGDPAGK